MFATAAATAESFRSARDPREPRTDWTLDEAMALFGLPFNELLFQSHSIHRANFDPNQVQVSTLLSIKTGGCSENCKYCSQSAHNETEIVRESLMPLDDVLAAAKAAKDTGASRFCMGAAWRNPKDRDMEKVVAMVEGVKSLGMETCMTLGMLTDDQTAQLKTAGLDYYNHNVDTSEAFYGEVVTTRTYQDRLDTLGRVRKAGMKVCSGGILGMGEDRPDRAAMLVTLATQESQPESVPLNKLVPIPGTPMADAKGVDTIEFARTVAVARILMPKSRVRLSAGRESMSDELQALCFFAGANSIFSGDMLLTTPNAGASADSSLFGRLGLERA